MFCKHCGNKIVEDANFCRNCGSSVASSIQGDEVSKNRKSIKIEDGGGKIQTKKDSTALEIIGFVIITGGILFFVWLAGAFGGGNKSDISKSAAQPNNMSTSTTFYTQAESTNIHDCAAITCKIVATLSINTSFALPYTSINNLPTWVEIKWQDQSNGTNGVGYIKNTTLGENMIATTSTNSDALMTQTIITPGINSPISQTTKLDLSAIVKEWRKSTAYVECQWYNPNTMSFFQTMSGSGLLARLSSGVTVITNKHVVYDSQYGIAQSCEISFPDDKFLFYSIETSTIPAHTLRNGVTVQELAKQGNIATPDNGTDVAYLSGFKLNGLYSKPPIALDDRARDGHIPCLSDPDIGEPVVIIGYPSYGTNTSIFDSTLSGIEVTATEGIISGNDSGYYTTSAKIEHGNSGGLAIDEKNDCYLGIPSAAITGQIESLGRILPAKYILN